MREVERGSFVNCDLTIESIVSKFGTHDQGPILILVIKFEQKKLKPGGARSSSPFFDSAETLLNCKKSMFPWANFDETHIIRTSVGHSITLAKNQSTHSGGGKKTFSHTPRIFFFQNLNSGR
jgi:hypothetical protein